MKQICLVIALLALGSSAQAGEAISFKVNGQRVTIAAPRNCRSLSCVSVTAPGLHDNDDRALPVATSQPLPPPVAPAALPAAPLATSVVALPPAPPIPAPPPVVVVPAPPPPVALEPPPPRRPVVVQTVDERPRPTPVTRETEDDPDSPRGDWQSEGNKGTVRIKECGSALCGYMLDADGAITRETVLVKMIPNGDDAWSGTIKSRASGESYYATMTLKRGDTLRVEACAVWHFFCSGNDWSRAVTSRQWVSSRRSLSEPHS